MGNENRVVELLAETLIKQDEMLGELRGVKSEMVKLNLVSSENTRAIFKLATEVENIAKLHERVTSLEKVVYK